MKIIWFIHSSSKEYALQKEAVLCSIRWFSITTQGKSEGLFCHILIEIICYRELTSLVRVWRKLYMDIDEYCSVRSFGLVPIFGFTFNLALIRNLPSWALYIHICNYQLYWCVEPTYIKVPDYKEKHLRLTLQYFYNTRDITFFHFSPAEGPKTSFFLWP